MSELIVVAYPDEARAEEVRRKLVELQKEHLIDLEDAAIVSKDHDGRVRLNQAVNLTAAGALSGGFWGVLIGALFLNPLLGAAVGAGAGALSGRLADIGVNDDFMRELGETLTPGGSALFVLLRRGAPDKFIPEIEGYGGTLLRTSLPYADEARLRAALEGRGVTADPPEPFGTTA